MRTFKKKTAQVLDKIYCDICSSRCSNEYCHEYALIETSWGYFSKRDGEKHDIHICENCFEDLLAWMKNKREKNGYKPESDPFSGI